MPSLPRCCLLLGLLALAALLGGVTAQDARGAAASAAAAAPPNDYFDGRTINICTSDYAPISRCLGREPAQFTGYDVALMERVSDRLGWAPERLNWTCMDWYDMIDALKTGNGVCDVAAGGVDISEDRLAVGVAFSFPTLRGGYKIMVQAEETSTDYWLFFAAFSWELWVAIVGTSIAVGVIVFAAERWAWIRRPRTKPQFPGLQERVWQALGRPMQTADMTAATFSASLIVLVFSLMCLILVALYTSATTANLTAQQLQKRIRSVADLPGKAVGTWDDPEYITDLAKRNIDAVGYAWNSDEDLQRMFDALRSGEVQAIVLDSYVLEYEAGLNCDLVTVGNDWKQYDQAIAFPAGTDAALVSAVNRALVVLQEMGEIEALQAQYVTPEARCKTSGVQESTSQVSFADVSGLWILLAGTVAAALLIYLGGQLALCGARRLARTKTYRATRARLGSSATTRFNRLGSLSRSVSGRRGAACENGGGSKGAADSRAESGLGPAPPDPQVLSAAVADMAAQLQQLLAVQAAAAGGGKACNGT